MARLCEINKYHHSSEKGVYLVIVGFFMVVLVALCLLVIGYGYLSTTASRQDNITNLAVTAALQSFVESEAEKYKDRADEALARLNEILQKNEMPGLEGELGDIGHDGSSGLGGTMELGKWIPELPEDGTDPCGDESLAYPCFLANEPPDEDTPEDTEVTAVRIRVENQPANPLTVPFAKFFGEEKAYIKSDAIATLVPRCTAYMMDASPSVNNMTHIKPIPGNFNIVEQAGRYKIVFTKNVGLPVIRREALLDPYGNGIFFDPSHCNDFLGDSGYCGADCGMYSSYYLPELIALCGLEHAAGSWVNRPAVGPYDYTKHYISDYRIVGTGFNEEMLMDTFTDGIYEGWRPFLDYMKALNVGLRITDRASAEGDLAYIQGFNGEMLKSAPETGMTDNFPLLIQYSNMRHRGLIDSIGAVVTDELHPNFADLNIFPISSTEAEWSGTNIGEALETAFTVLTNNCPEISQKSVIFFTDGVVNCKKVGAAWDCDDILANPGNEAQYQYFLNAMNQIIGPMVGGGTTYMQAAIDAQISVNFVTFSEYTGPNFRNVQDPDTGDFIDEFGALVQLGYGVVGVPSNKQIVNIDSTRHPDSGPHVIGGVLDDDDGAPPGDDDDDDYHCNDIGADAAAYKCFGKDGYIFRQPHKIMAELAAKTGGFYCPIMELCDDLPCGDPSGAYYDDPDDNDDTCVLRPELRTATYQTCAVKQLSLGAQAASCVEQILTGSRYMLVEPAGVAEP